MGVGEKEQKPRVSKIECLTEFLTGPNKIDCLVGREGGRTGKMHGGGNEEAHEAARGFGGLRNNETR